MSYTRAAVSLLCLFALMLVTRGETTTRIPAKSPGSDPFFEVRRDGRWGFINAAGVTVIKPAFENVAEFVQGFAPAFSKGLWGFIDLRGRVAVEFAFRQVRPFSGGFAAVRLGPRWGYVNGSGIVAIKPQFQDAHNFREGLARVEFWSGVTCGARPGEKVIFTNDNAPDWVFTLREDPQSGCVYADSRFGFVDSTGFLVIPARFSAARDFSGDLASVRMNDKWGYINRNGTVVVTPQFEWADNFSEGRAAVRLQGLYGYIDSKGSFIVPVKYAYARNFSEGLAAVQLGGLWGYVRSDGTLAISSRFQSAGDFSEGLAAVGLAGTRCGFVDSKGQVVQLSRPCRSFKYMHGLAPVDFGKIVYVDRSGKTVAFHSLP